MRTQWTAKGNRDAGSSCSCDRGLRRYLRNFGGGGYLNTPNPPSRYATDSHYHYTYLLSLVVSVCTTCLDTKTPYFIHTLYSLFVWFLTPIPMAKPSKAWVWCRSQFEITVSNPAGALMSVCFECCVLSGRGAWDGLITSSEESYRVCASLWSHATVKSRPSKNTLKSSRLRIKIFGYGPQYMRINWIHSAF